MAITVKDMAGVEHELASKGTTSAALATGIIGTALGVLNGGLGNGILGGGNVTPAEAAVGISKYYEDRIADLERMTTEFTNVREALCQLRERVSVNETANAYQNKIVEIGFNSTDTRFATERKITDYEIAAAVCDFVPASKMLRPEQIGDPYNGVKIGMGYFQPNCCGNGPAPFGYGGFGGF